MGKNFIKYNWIDENGEIFRQSDTFFETDNSSWNTWSSYKFNSVFSRKGKNKIEVYLNNRLYDSYEIIFE